jgi:hypothetical protein
VTRHYTLSHQDGWWQVLNHQGKPVLRYRTETEAALIAKVLNTAEPTRKDYGRGYKTLKRKRAA